MAKYKLELKPIKVYGLEQIPEDRRQLFKIALNALSEMIVLMDDVDSATLNDDFSLTIEGSQGADESMRKLHDQAIITRIE